MDELIKKAKANKGSWFIDVAGVEDLIRLAITPAQALEIMQEREWADLRVLVIRPNHFLLGSVGDR